MSGLERAGDIALDIFTKAADIRFLDNGLNREVSEEAREARKRREDLSAMPYHEYLQTPEWQQMRKSKVRSAGFRCQRCFWRDRKLDVHHLTYERRGAEHRDDLIVLCRPCHEAEHGRII